jgi:hypothetical protein
MGGERDDPTTPDIARPDRTPPRGSAPRARHRCECEIDDMNPQIFGVVMDQLYARARWRFSTWLCR